MAELIDKWEVVNKLIRLENNYQFYKKKWDADVLYRRIRELEVGIGKTPGIELVRCKDCKDHNRCEVEDLLVYFDPTVEHFCCHGERKDNGTD